MLPASDFLHVFRPGLLLIFPLALVLLCGSLSLGFSGHPEGRSRRNLPVIIGAAVLLVVLLCVLGYWLLGESSNQARGAFVQGERPEARQNTVYSNGNEEIEESKELLDPQVSASAQAAERYQGLAGEVLDPAGLPVEGARVWAFYLSPDRDQVLEDETSGKGTFRFEDAVEGRRYLVKAWKKDEGSAEGVFTATREARIVLRLEGGGKVFGHVYRHSGEPAAAFDLYLVPSGAVRDTERYHFETWEENLVEGRKPEAFKGEGPYRFEGAEGYFEISGLPPGCYDTIVKIDGGAFFDCRYKHPGWNVKVEKGTETGPIEIREPEGETMAVVIRDKRTGHPIEGARLIFTNHGITLASFRTGPSGRVRLTLVPADSGLWIEAQGYECLSVPSNFLAMEPLSGREREIFLTKGVGLDVFVKEGSGSAEKGARVFVENHWNRTVQQVTDEQGKAAFEDLPAGVRMKVRCLHPSGLIVEAMVDLPESGRGVVRFGGDDTAPGPGILGRIRIGDRPLKLGYAVLCGRDVLPEKHEDPFIRMKKFSVSHDSMTLGRDLKIRVPVVDGVFRSGPLPPGSYGVIIEVGALAGSGHEFALSRMIDVTGDLETLEMQLPSGSITGKVSRVGGAGTIPLEGVMVQATRIPEEGMIPGGPLFSIRARTRSDRSGCFEIPALPDGRYMMYAMKKGYDLKVMDVKIEGGRCMDLGELLLSEQEGKGSDLGEELSRLYYKPLYKEQQKLEEMEKEKKGD